MLATEQLLAVCRLTHYEFQTSLMCLVQKSERSFPKARPTFRTSARALLRARPRGIVGCRTVPLTDPSDLVACPWRSQRLGACQRAVIPRARSRAGNPWRPVPSTALCSRPVLHVQSTQFSLPHRSGLSHKVWRPRLHLHMPPPEHRTVGAGRSRPLIRTDSRLELILDHCQLFAHIDSFEPDTPAIRDYADIVHQDSNLEFFFPNAFDDAVDGTGLG